MPTVEQILKYAKLLKKLFPVGRAWDAIKEDAIGLVDGMAVEFARIEGRATDLLTEFDPGTSVEMLSDWETLLALPDECTPALTTLQERQQQARAKLAAIGGISAPFLEGVAEALGYDAIISDYHSFRVGRSRVGDPLSNPFDPDTDVFRVGRNRVGEQLVVHGWRYVFEVNVEATVVEAFRVGENRVGDPLVSFGNELLECTINKLKPAHTFGFFTFREP